MYARTIRYLTVLAALLLIAAGPANAQFRNVGQSGANFLQIPTDARGASLGDSYVALAEGVTAIAWNPAGIHRSGGDAPGLEAQFSYVDWVVDTRLSTAAVSWRALRNITLGAHIVSFGMDDMEITTETRPGGTGETFGAGNLAAGGTFAMALTDRFRFGITGKWVHEYIWEASTNTFAVDLGSTYRTDFYNLRIGMSIRNFGADMKMEGQAVEDRIAEEAGIDNNPRAERLAENYALPQTFDVGIAVDPLDRDGHRVTVTATANDPSDNQTRGSIGAEYGFREMFFLRSGLKLGYDSGTVTFGLGFNLPLARVVSSLDYAFVELGDLGGTHLLTYSIGL